MQSCRSLGSFAFVSLAVLVLLAGTVVTAPAREDAAGRAAAQPPREAETLIEEWAAALQSGQVDRMKPLLADDYLYVNPRGEAIDGAMLLRQLKERTIRFTISPEGRSLRMHRGGALVVTGTCRVAGEMDGKKIDGDYRYLDVFERHDERWVAIATSLTRVEGGAANAKKE